MSLFDSLRDSASAVVKSSFGDSAVWRPTGGGPEQSAIVLYKGPTEKEKLANVDYETDHLTMEYDHNEFTGLYDSVKGGKREPITITLMGSDVEFIALTGRKLGTDGKTVEMRLKLKA